MEFRIFAYCNWSSYILLLPIRDLLFWIVKGPYKYHVQCRYCIYLKMKPYPWLLPLYGKKQYHYKVSNHQFIGIYLLMTSISIFESHFFVIFHKRSFACVTDSDKLNLDKLGYGGLVLGSSQFMLLVQLPQKWRSIQKWSKVTQKMIILLH